MMVIIQNEELIQRLVEKARADGCSVEDILQTTLTDALDTQPDQSEESFKTNMNDLRRCLDMSA